MEAQGKRQIVACELFGLLKEKGGGMNVRPGPTLVVTEASRQITFMLRLTSNAGKLSSNKILEHGGHMNESHGLDNSVTSGQFCDKNKEYQITIQDIFLKMLLFVG